MTNDMIGNRSAPFWQQLAWFVGLWTAGVGTLALFTVLLRLWLK